jgi:acylphosphatase
MATHIIVAGRVQGVGYRYAFADRAAQLGLAGWVRNRRDGTVEACVQGAAPAIDQIVAWARKGPPAARVDEVRVAPAGAEVPATGFQIAPTA